MNPSISLLHDLVAIPSVSGNEKKASEFLVEQMKQRGANEAFLDEVNNAVGIWGTGEKELWLIGHIDTVPGEIPVRIEPKPDQKNQGSPPLAKGENKLKRPKEGVLYGRGSVDAKGCLATFVEAVSRLVRENDVPLSGGTRSDSDAGGWKIMIVACVEEEIHTSKGARNLLDRKAPEAIIIGEPSSAHKITISYKGSLRCKASFETAEEHSSTDRENAHEQAIQFWNEIKAWSEDFNSPLLKRRGETNDRERGEVQKPKTISQLLQVVLISINSKNDGLKNTCDLEIRFRIPVGMSAQEIEDKVRSINSEPLTINFFGHENPILSSKNTPLIRSFLKAIRAQGLEPRFSKKTGTADMNVLGNHYQDVPIVAYGPGDSKLDHTPNEHLDLEEYEQAIEVLKRTLTMLLER